MTMYAIFTYDLDHPIKSWERLRSVQIHNARSKPIAHGIAGTQPPKILIGSEDIVGDARRHLLAHNLDPDRLPEGTNIAVEAVMSATPEFFLSGTADERATRLDAWEQAQVEYANRRFGPHMILSMVMHYDEEIPHAHLLLMPLKLAPDKRRSDQTPNWRLDTDQLWRRAKLREQQTDYLLTQLAGTDRQRDEARRATRVAAIGRKELESERLAFLAEKRDAEPALKKASAFLEALGGLDERHWDQPIDVRRALDAAKAVVREARVQDAERRERSVGIASPPRSRPGIRISAA